MRYLIQLAYKGTAYHGWQKQLNAHSVQAELELKLSLVLGEHIETLGCGRTDTGVHALKYFAHFDCSKELVPEKTIYKLNQILPTDIAVYDIRSVSDQFNARFDALYREYEYHITGIKDPFATETAWYQYGKINIPLMNMACQILLRHHDFECFSKVHTQVHHFACDIYSAVWKEDGNGKTIFTIRANRFLRNMVRAIVGTMIEVGREKITLATFEEILNSKDRCEAGQSVPAHGLFLTDIAFPPEKYNL